jgi:hypothetical protein
VEEDGSGPEKEIESIFGRHKNAVQKLVGDYLPGDRSRILNIRA